jgi:effector-binding domain-containing protein
VFVYRDGTKDRVTVEIGVEVAAPFDTVDGVSYSQTPSGDVVSTVHLGAYSGTGAAHEALVGWCRNSQLTRAGVWWEVYGDWHEDPAQVETEVFHLLRTGPT